MSRAWLFISGYKSLKFEQKYAAEIMNICMTYGYIYRNTKFENEHFQIECTLGVAKKILGKCRERRIDAEVSSERGLPGVFIRYRKRYGALVGVFAFAAIIFLSSRVIWDIRIDGNQRLSDGEVIDELRACGFFVGSARDREDIGVIENLVMIRSDDISWIAINIRGTVAEVEIRESEVIEQGEEYAASNVVAKRDGQIELFEDVRGNILLNIGDFVREGELIVSGLYDSKTQGLRYTGAKGKVFARTEREILAEIPLKYKKKVYTGRIITEKYLVFFEKEIKIYRNDGNSLVNYDIIGMERKLFNDGKSLASAKIPLGECDVISAQDHLDLFGMGTLPFGIRTVRYMEYVYEDAERSPEEAERLAEYKIGELASELARGAELLRKTETREITEGHYVIKYKVECIEDIAEVRKIEIPDLP